MRRFALPLLLFAGCVSAEQERAQKYAEVGFQSYQRGDLAAAELSFRAALAIKPNDPNLHYNLGKCCEQQHNLAGAEEMYQACLNQEPNHSESRHALARLWWDTGRREKASAMVQGWLADQPRLSAAYAEEGWRLSRENDLPNAQARLQQALRLDPRNFLALIELAALFERMSMPERSLVLYQRALEQDPGGTDVVDRVNELTAKGIGPPLPD
jgi:tetratricopeptide (TPR) repeat protein